MNYYHPISSDQCPSACNCKWANGKREADCTNAGFTAVPTHLHHEIQILRMGGNYVRVLGREVFKAAGLLNLQRIYMNNCHVQVGIVLNILYVLCGLNPESLHICGPKLWISCNIYTSHPRVFARYIGQTETACVL